MSVRPTYAANPARNFVQFGGTAQTSRNPTAATNMSLLVDGATNGTMIHRIRVMPTATISSGGCILFFLMDDGASTVFNLFRDIAYGTQTPSNTLAAVTLYEELFDRFVLKSSHKLYVCSTVSNTLAAHVEAADV